MVSYMIKTVKNCEHNEKYYWVCELRLKKNYKCNVRLITKRNDDQSNEFLSKQVKKHNHEPNALRDKAMTPTPQEHDANQQMETMLPADCERVVISGMAGLYPKCLSIKNLEYILYNKVNPVSSENLRWKYNHPEVSPYTGNVPILDRFDAQFFKVHIRLAACMDPMARKILEQTFVAIYDAGLNPAYLSDKNVGVYVGTCFSESEKVFSYGTYNRSGLGISGSSKTMFANRISYWLNLKGPSMSIDASCCSSTAALEKAYQAMSRGECEAAIVCGANLCLHPQSLVHYGRIMNISTDGKTKSFAEDAAGCAKSEAINVLFLQRAKDAKRIYANIVYVKSEFVSIQKGKTGPKYGFYRNPNHTVDFLNIFYDEAGVSPSAVEYVEAFGSAQPEADKSELEAIDRVFCKERTKPLLVGSVMSNIGYGEAASGISAVTKVLLGYHKGMMAGNLHCENLRSDIPALKEGRLKVITNNQHFQRTYTAINSMSVTGINSHVLLYGHYKPKDLSLYKTSIPRLVTISGRQEKSVRGIFDRLKNQPIDPELLALLHNIHETDIPGHLGKGFIILETDAANETVSLSECAEFCDKVNRPLWFVYSGMGSQWAGMGAQLMRIPIFAAAIERCRKALEPKGIDIVHIITSPDKAIFNNILHSFVGIAAVQIGLTDILTKLGIVPDKIIGHSVGELGCAYADGCLTAEEMILSAYSRGLVSLETPFIRGSMAAVGMGFQQMSKICPPEIQIACHNSADSCTISGPAEVMSIFVEELTAKGVFAKEVPCSNIAYHSRYISEAAPGLLKYLKEVIKTPRARSERWVSTSIPQDQWHQDLAKFSSAEYHTNNLLSPVLFEEASRMIPSNAVLVEVAPHGLLQAILKRSLSSSCINIALTRRGHTDNVVMLLNAVGKLYLEGYTVKVHELYPKVEFPVSTGTQYMSHFVDWVHDQKWPIPLFQSARRGVAASCKFPITIYDVEYSYLKGNMFKNKILVPFSFVLVAVWDTLCMSLGAPKKSLNVEFQDVRFYVQPKLYDQKTVKLNVSIFKGTGHFEVIDDHTKVATGFIIHKELENDEDIFEQPQPVTTKMDYELCARDIYHLLYEKEYAYSGEFCSIHSANELLSEACILWNANWVTFIDGIFQLNTLRYTHGNVTQPDRIRRIVIDVENHKKTVKLNKNYLKAQLCDVQDQTRCGGVLLEGMRFHNLLQLINDQITLHTLKFANQTPIMNELLEDNLPSKESLPAGTKIILQSNVIGDVNSLCWVQAPKLAETGIPVKVYYASINVRDVKRALGVISPDKDKSINNYNYGYEFSGLTKSGERVMGLVRNGAASSHVMTEPELLWPVPSYWTLEDAATVPFAYVYAYYCLDVKATARIEVNNMKRRSVLVHGGAGALGQAVINIALANGYKVFTTVSDIHKKRFLMQLFPELNDEHIGCSRDFHFKDLVLKATRGIGCNAVICCLKEELKNVSFGCCGASSILFDTTQTLSNITYDMGMDNLNKERSYLAVDISGIFDNFKTEEYQKLHDLVSEGIALGHVRPLTRVTYAPLEAPRAFRLLAASQHRGRVLLRMEDPLPSIIQTRLCFDAAYCHVIFCGDSYLLGLQLADKLIDGGVKKLYLHFNNPESHVHFKLRVWKKMNIQVTVSFGTLADTNNVNILMKNAMSLGPVEGVHVIADDALQDPFITIIDLATRTSCPILKYFLVLTMQYHKYQAADQRAKIGLPVTLLDISLLETFQDPYGVLWYRGAMKAVDQALRSTQSTLIAQPKRSASTSLIQQLADLTGLNICHNTPEHVSLEELGKSLANLSPVCVLLRDVYDTYLEEKDIPSLTIEKIKDIENRTKESKFERVTGMGMFYSYVDPDELLGTTEMVLLPTLTNRSTMRDDEFNLDETFLCIVPGLEGHHARFRTLCERLKLPALVLQPGLDCPEETPHELAIRYSKVLLKRAAVQKKTFYILGYETGVAVALELAAVLEEHDETGIVFCLGDGPAEIKAMLDAELGKYDSEEALQTTVALHMFALVAQNFAPPEENTLHSLSSWRERVDACERELLGCVSHSAQYVRAVMESAYARIGTARRYSATPRALRSRIVLLRSLNSTLSGEKCSLQLYSQKELFVHNLALPLPHAASDLQVPTIINSYLEDDILQAYESRNWCDTYLLNADGFASFEYIK